MRIKAFYDEKDFLEDLRQGNEACFRQLYYQFKDTIYSYALALTKSSFHAEEVLQEVFIKVWNNRQRINKDLPLKPYLYKITKNHILNFLRKAANDEYLKQELFYNCSYHENLEDHIIYLDYKGLVEKAILNLPPKRQQIFELSRVQGMTNDEIAEIMGISKNTVKDQVVKATKALKSFLKSKIDITFSFFMLITRLF